MVDFCRPGHIYGMSKLVVHTVGGAGAEEGGTSTDGVTKV